MKIPLIIFISDATPFLAQSDTIYHEGQGAVGYTVRGPRVIFGSKESEEAAVTIERRFIGRYIDSWIRGQLFLCARKDGFRSVAGCEHGRISQEKQLHPLRSREDGELINPLIVVGITVADINPEWEFAKCEYRFAFDPGAVVVAGHVNRECNGNHYVNLIHLTAHLKPEGIFVERFKW